MMGLGKEICEFSMIIAYRLNSNDDSALHDFAKKEWQNHLGQNHIYSPFVINDLRKSAFICGSKVQRRRSWELNTNVKEGPRRTRRGFSFLLRVSRFVILR